MLVSQSSVYLQLVAGRETAIGCVSLAMRAAARAAAGDVGDEDSAALLDVIARAATSTRGAPIPLAVDAAELERCLQRMRDGRAEH